MSRNQIWWAIKHPENKDGSLHRDIQGQLARHKKKLLKFDKMVDRFGPRYIAEHATYTPQKWRGRMRKSQRILDKWSVWSNRAWRMFGEYAPNPQLKEASK